MKLKSPLVSIVVPIYKVEKYLRQCVDSILAQTLTDIEVILVDDGSPDSCPAIVDEYAAADSRVIAIHQPNGGYGKAVNTGIARASAPYIGIIESDDWIEPTMYEKLYKRAKQTGAELTKCMFWYYNSFEKGKKQNVLYTESVADLRDAPDEIFTAEEWEELYIFHSSLWSNLYDAELLRSVPIIESPSAAYQDFPFAIEIYAKAKSISVIKEPLLHYRVEPNQGSSCTTGGKRVLCMLDMTEAASDVMTRYNLINKHKEAWYYHVYIANVWGIDRISKEYQQEYFARFRKLLEPIMKDPDFTWKYFNAQERRRAWFIGATSQIERHFLELDEKLFKLEAYINYPKLLQRYRWVKIKRFFSWGKKRKKYKESARLLKRTLNEYRFMMR